MAHFYGIIKGQRSQAARTGSKASGLHVTATSDQGAVLVSMYEQDGVDMARISLAQHDNKGTNKPLYEGPVSGIMPERVISDEEHLASLNLPPRR